MLSAQGWEPDAAADASARLMRTVEALDRRISL